MSKLVNPHTGQTFGGTEPIPQAQFIAALQNLNAKIHALAQQQINLGMLLEYTLKSWGELTTANDEPLLPLDMEAFPVWAEARIKEMKEEAAEGMRRQEALRAQIETDIYKGPFKGPSQPTASTVNLNDE